MNENKLPESVQSLLDAIVKADVKIQFGLEQQGHIPYINETLATKGYNYHTWLEIAKTIGWEPVTAMCYYHEYCEKERADKIQQFQAKMKKRIAYLVKTEHEEIAKLDGIYGILRTTQWNLINELAARRHELEDALRVYNTGIIVTPKTTP